jgi:hypothetical protein
VDVTLPNGHVIKGVPEGTPKHVIAGKAIKAGLATNKDFGYDEVTAEDVDGSFLEGMGAGMMNVARRGTNLLLPDALTPEFASDEAIAEQEELDKYLEWGHGGGGKLTGELIATAPVGGGVGAAGKGLGRTLLAARRAGSVGKAPARALANTLNSRVGRGALEGATFGTIMADPDERGAGAAFGGAVGAGAGALGRAVGAMGRKFRLTDISDEAKAVQQLTGHHIPLSQAAKPGTIRMIYNAFLANVPGVGGKYRAKYEAALQDFRHFVATKAHPDLGDIEIPRTATMGEIFETLGKYWDDAYEPMRRAVIGVFKKHNPTAPDFLAKEVQKVSRGRISLPQAGEMTTGAKILDLKNLINGEILPKESGIIQKELQAYVRGLDDLLEANFLPGSKNRHIWDDFVNLREPYKNWIDLQSAAQKVVGAEFSAAQIARASQRGAGGLREGSKGVIQKAGEMGAKTLEDFPSKQGLFQTVAALGLTGSAMTGTALPVAAGMGAVIGAGKVMTTEAFEKLISGQSKYLQTYARQLRAAGYTGRQIATILGLENADAT